MMNRSRLWNRPWVLSMGSAILLSLSFPPFDAAILQIPALLLLFRLCDLSESWRQLIYYSYPAFILWNLFTTYWLMMATIAGGLAAIFANALLMVIPLLIIRTLFNSRYNPVFVSFLAAMVWVCYEFLHHNWDLAWPWLTLGNGWSNLTGFTQYISFTGVFGVSFWVVCSSALFYNYIRKPGRPLLYTALLVLFAFPLFSAYSLIRYHPEQEESIEVAIVQPNSDSYQSYGGHASLDELLTKLLVLSKGIVTKNTDLLIWPENALDSSLTWQNRYFDRISDSLKVWQTDLITGSGFVEHYNDDNRPLVARVSGNGTIYNVFNSAIHFKDGQTDRVYKKGRLVPMVERFPFIDFFQSADKFDWVDWGRLAGYGAGKQATVFGVNGHTTPALICYDSVFPGWVNEFVNSGADFLTIITNDGWWGDSPGHIQHFAYARLRAMEQRKWVARSANNGISGIISPEGHVKYETEYWTEDAFIFTIYSSEKPTFYARHGDWLGYLASAFSLLSLIILFKSRHSSSRE